MKVYFFITSSDNFAKGGHFRSCLTIAEALKNNIDVEIVNIGKIKSPVFFQSEVNVVFYPINWYNFIFQIIKLILKFYKSKDTRLISFDFFSYFIIRHISFFNKIPLGYVRCGGKNPKYSPYSKTVFCFSKENYDYYMNNKMFKESNIHLLPNRIKKNKHIITSDDLMKVVNNSYPNIIRIGRFVVNYEEVNQSAILLSNFLEENNILHNLIFIGYPDDEEATHFKSLKNQSKDKKNIFILDTPNFTNNAAQFIKEADLIIGTGRGAMEAFVECVPVCIYSSSHHIPIIVDENQLFDEGFSQNFSKRVKLSSVSKRQAEEKILLFFTDKIYRDKVKSFQSKKEAFFNVDFVVDQYSQGIANMEYNSSLRIRDYINNFKIFILKLFYISKV